MLRLTQFLICSISPGPVTLTGLMDPMSYFVSPEVAKLDREQELAKYDLFPMYPTGQYMLSPPLQQLPPNRSPGSFLSFFSFPPRCKCRSGDRRRHIRHPVPLPHFHHERKRERRVGPVLCYQQLLSYRHSSEFELRSYRYGL